MKLLDQDMFSKFLFKNLEDSNNYIDSFKELLENKNDLEKLGEVDKVLSCQHFSEVSLAQELERILFSIGRFIEVYNQHQLIFSLQMDNMQNELYQKVINNKSLLISSLNSRTFLDYKPILYPNDIESFKLLVSYIPDIIRECDGQGIYIYIHFLTQAYIFNHYDEYCTLKFNRNMLRRKLTECVSTVELAELYQMTIAWNKSIENTIKNILEAKKLINTMSSCYDE